MKSQKDFVKEAVVLLNSFSNRERDIQTLASLLYTIWLEAYNKGFVDCGGLYK